MNYPIQGLAIIGPILLLVLLIITPIIGVFGGWKRATYWGVGNLAFYFIGLIVFKTAGDKIYSVIEPLLTQVLGSKVPAADLQPLAKSLVAPVFFLVLAIVSNLLLFICYYAFAKRCMRIGKYSPEKRFVRLEEKIKKAKLANKDPETINKLVAKKNKWEVRVQKVVNTLGHKKWFNRTIGGITMTVLCLPTIFTSAQVIMMATTSKTTRTSNFVTGVYDFLNKTGKAFNWMAYYDSTKTPKDFDALFGLLGVVNKKVTIDGQEKELTTALSDTFKGVGDIVKKSGAEGGTLTDIADAVKTTAKSWNPIMKQAASEMSALFQSENVTQAAKSIISSLVPASESISLNEAQIREIFAEDGKLNTIAQDYQQALEGHPEESLFFDSSDVLTRIETNQTCIDNIVNSVKSIIKIDGQVSDEAKTLYNNSLDTLMNLMFVAK